MEDYSIRRRIGDGAQGVVYEVLHRQTQKQYAMKAICCADQEQVNLALKEIKVLLQLRHPNIVSYVDFFLVFNSAKVRSEFAEAAAGAAGAAPETAFSEAGGGEVRLYHLSESENGARCGGGAALSAGRRPTVGTPLSPASPSQAFTDQVRAHWLGEEEIAVCLVMELCTCGDMQAMIRECADKVMETGKHPLTEAQALAWMEQCAAALQFIHEKGFLHRDLKPTNIFFDTKKDVKIGDFGLAATVGLGRNSAVGTPLYLAPERMLQQRYDGKVDVWGLGLVMLELLTLRDQPVNCMVLENPLVVETVVQQVTKMGFSAKLAGLLRDMLQRYPEARPSPTAILHRLNAMTTASPHLGMSATLLGGISCPKIVEAVCNLCEVEPATVMCTNCKAAYCDGCDQARHKHQSRQSHERTAINSFLMTNISNGVHSLQQTLSSSRGTTPGSQQSFEPLRGCMQNASVFPSQLHSGNQSTSTAANSLSRQQHSLSSENTCGKTFSRLQLAPGNSVSNLDFSMSHSVLMKGNGASANTILHVPQDYPTIDEALRVAATMPHIRRILIAGNTVHSAPLVLTNALPDNLRLIGESPSPVVEVADSPFAVHCASGKGVMENLIIRHVGRSRKPLEPLQANTVGGGAAAGTTAGKDSAQKAKTASRPTAVSITGGHWRLHRCRISCAEGNGVVVGGSGGAAAPEVAPAAALPSSPSGEAGNTSIDHEDTSAAVDPIITKCTFIEITGAGVLLSEKVRGTYEGNTFSGCGYAAFWLKRESTPRIRANHITDSAESGIYCQDAGGTVEYNLIAESVGCGVVIKGPYSTVIFRKNRVLSNGQAGFLCCDRAAPFIADNEIKNNQRAGVLIKAKAAPKVTKNHIEDGKEAGVYVLDQGCGIIEENRIRGNQNAGILVTTQGNPHVIHNAITHNAYEGVWVCRDGRGTFCENDLRGNKKGPMDLDKACKVAWVGNVEQ